MTRLLLTRAMSFLKLARMLNEAYFFNIVSVWGRKTSYTACSNMARYLLNSVYVSSRTGISRRIRFWLRNGRRRGVAFF